MNLVPPPLRQPTTALTPLKPDGSTPRPCQWRPVTRAQAGVKGTLGRLVGIFENQERKHRTYVYVLIVTEVLEDWEDSVNIGRKREWFKIEDAVKVLQYHKPVQASYFETLRQGYSANNGTPLVATTYSVSAQSSMPGIR
ncbi:diphosphoinositol polyphosphate phosphohydrolase 1 isoform X5 [Mesoplodon densirostris]|uniref:diphosphoinositol polyphosphate phosphohydrolase 1 isoform X5 n=1 Tax=Mesoplodon densirostris TaxID=48708 RepID=UPI0028DC4CF3|nr:diphosphoinositol polyphosphate phosphohydrolase 1 isoform X5 [Mesoplodon densirostris]